MLMRDFDFVNDQITYLEYNISTSGLKPVPAATGQKQDSLSQGKHQIYVRENPLKCLIFTEPEEQKQDKHWASYKKYIHTEVIYGNTGSHFGREISFSETFL